MISRKMRHKRIYLIVRWMDVSGDGQSGESQPDFKDFQPFGPWTSVSTKQFARNETVCGVNVNRYYI